MHWVQWLAHGQYSMNDSYFYYCYYYLIDSRPLTRPSLSITHSSSLEQSFQTMCWEIHLINLKFACHRLLTQDSIFLFPQVSHTNAIIFHVCHDVERFRKHCPRGQRRVRSLLGLVGMLSSRSFGNKSFKELFQSSPEQEFTYI